MYEDEIYCLLNYGQNKRALDKINRCYEQSYVTPSIMALESVALARLGFDQRALTLCEELFDIGTTDYNIFHLLVESFRALGRYSNIEKLCTIALKYNNTEEYLKILLNTYVRMLKFDLAQNIALKIFIKTKDQSIGILYCIFAIIKHDSKHDSIEVAQKFMNKLDFSEFKPEIRFYLEYSLLLALQDYDKILEYFNENDPPYDIYKLELLLFVHVKRGDYISALNLITNCPNKSLNMSIYEMELSLIANVEYKCSDVNLKLEYIKRRALYKYLHKNNAIPNSPDDLWTNRNDLNEYIQLLKSELVKYIEKPSFFKFAVNFIPFINFDNHILENISTNFNALINIEKIKLACNFFGDVSIQTIDERIKYFTDFGKRQSNLDLAILLIEFHLIKYYRKNRDISVIIQLLRIVELLFEDINSTVLYNVLIDLYGMVGCIERSKCYFIKMNYKESLLSTQSNRFLHYSLLSLRKLLVDKCTDSYLNWYNNTRGYISNSLVTAVEKCPNMLPHLCRLDRMHSTSAIRCYNLSVKLLGYIDSDINKLINQSKLYIDEFKSLINGNMNWYCRNTTSCFSHLCMPTFKFSCLNSIPLINMDLNENGIKSDIFPNNTTYFEEPEFIFPHKFYRSVASFQTLNEIITNCKYFPKDNLIKRHTESALYRLNLDNYRLIELETLIFVNMILLINNLNDVKDIKTNVTSLKKYIAEFISHFDFKNNKFLISDFSNSILDTIQHGTDIIEIISCIEKCVESLNNEIVGNNGKIDLNVVVETSKFVSLINLIPGRLLSVLRWTLSNNKIGLNLGQIDEFWSNLTNKIMSFTNSIERRLSGSKGMGEVEILVCKSNISILKRFKDK